ncbi:MAG: fatty acid desaturase [Anaerolineales bacterium]
MALATDEIDKKQIYQAVAEFAQPDLGQAIWQLVNTLVPYIALWAAMVIMLKQGVSYWLVLPLIVLAAGFLVRLFIIFHDCCHLSFFKSRQANRLVGYITGLLAFTPYDQWQHSHAVHHATVGNLDKRGVGDVMTMTVDEYKASSPAQRLFYRLYRHPIVLLLIGPGLVFFLGHRIPHKDAKPGQRQSVWIVNLLLLGILVAATFTIGLGTYLAIQVPIMMIAGTAGVWLFYVQHQYENAYWARQDDWDPLLAALQGSSYYKLPKALQWITGNIGLHHIHHIQPRVPNYRLQACQDQVSEIKGVEPITILSGFKSLGLHLWDEERQELVGFRAVR